MRSCRLFASRRAQELAYAVTGWPVSRSRSTSSSAEAEVAYACRWRPCRRLDHAPNLECACRGLENDDRREVPSAVRGMGRFPCTSVEETAQEGHAGGHPDLLPPALHAGELGHAPAPGPEDRDRANARAPSSAPILEQITAKVAAGSSFYAAAAAFPEHFEFQWIEAIRTGEITGKMAMVLTELNKQIRDSRETKRKVKASLMYPMILVCVAVIAVTLMLWMVVPTFAKMFHDMDAQLPAITQYVVDASNWIVKLRPLLPSSASSPRSSASRSSTRPRRAGCTSAACS